MTGIFIAQLHTSTPVVQSTDWHQWFDWLEQTHSELLHFIISPDTEHHHVWNATIAKNFHWS